MNKACDKVLEFRGIKSLILSTSDGSNSSRSGAFVPSMRPCEPQPNPQSSPTPKTRST